MSSETFKPVADEVVDQRYRLETELGRGGMGSVWRAHHLALDIPCAVKFIDERVADDEQLRSRFRQEARAAARLPSRHVVQMFDHGLWQGTPYIVMELLVGEPLSRRLERRGRLSPEQTLGVLQGVVAALTKAHELGIVHRDLKPENVFLVREGKREFAKVLDFGVAKLTSEALLATDHSTGTGTMLGTPFYMSPEQAMSTAEVDHRADLWALAVIVFRCLTGKLPFDGEALGALLMAIINEPAPLVTDVAPDLPAAVDKWWLKAVDRDQDGRFQSAEEQLEGLGRALRNLVGTTQILSQWPAPDDEPEDSDGVRSVALADTPPAAELPTRAAQRAQANADTIAAGSPVAEAERDDPDGEIKPRHGGVEDSAPDPREATKVTPAAEARTASGDDDPRAELAQDQGRNRRLVGLVAAIVVGGGLIWLVASQLGDGGSTVDAGTASGATTTAATPSAAPATSSDEVGATTSATAPPSASSAGATPSAVASATTPSLPAAPPPRPTVTRTASPPPTQTSPPPATTTTRKRPDPGY